MENKERKKFAEILDSQYMSSEESFRVCSKSFRGYGMCKSLTVTNESNIFK